jgi:hypothetical protein
MVESFKLFPDKSYEDFEKLPNEAEVILRAVEIRGYIGMLKGTISKNASAAAQVLVNGYSEYELRFADLAIKRK